MRIWLQEDDFIFFWTDFDTNIKNSIPEKSRKFANIFFIWQIEQSGMIALTTFNKNSIMVLLTLEIRQKRDGFDLTEELMVLKLFMLFLMFLFTNHRNRGL